MARGMIRSTAAEGSNLTPSLLWIEPLQILYGKPPEIFLERCYQCGKLMPENTDIYLCGDFRGFCSPRCQDIRVNLDKAANRSNGGSELSKSKRPRFNEDV